MMWAPPSTNIVCPVIPDAAEDAARVTMGSGETLEEISGPGD